MGGANHDNDTRVLYCTKSTIVRHITQLKRGNLLRFKLNGGLAGAEFTRISGGEDVRTTMWQ